MPHKKKPTAKQRKARADFKKHIAEAKRIQRQNPNISWQTAIKRSYGK